MWIFTNPLGQFPNCFHPTRNFAQFVPGLSTGAGLYLRIGGLKAPRPGVIHSPGDGSYLFEPFEGKVLLIFYHEDYPPEALKLLPLSRFQLVLLEKGKDLSHQIGLPSCPVCPSIAVVPDHRPTAELRLKGM